MDLQDIQHLADRLTAHAAERIKSAESGWELVHMLGYLEALKDANVIGEYVYQYLVKTVHEKAESNKMYLGETWWKEPKKEVDLPLILKELGLISLYEKEKSHPKELIELLEAQIGGWMENFSNLAANLIETNLWRSLHYSLGSLNRYKIPVFHITERACSSLTLRDPCYCFYIENNTLRARIHNFGLCPSSEE